MSDKIKFAVVGCGHIGKRHAEMVTRNEEAELVGLCDVKPASELGIDHFNVPFFKCNTRLRIRVKIHNTIYRGRMRASVVVSARPRFMGQMKKSDYSLDNIEKIPYNLHFK